MLGNVGLIQARQLTNFSDIILLLTQCRKDSEATGITQKLKAIG